MNQKERKDIIRRLLSNDEDERIYYNEIPEEYREDDKVIKAAYRAGICRNGKKCFDVENQSYYVYLDVLKRNHYSKELEWDKDYRRFDSFTDYYNYLNGDIYEDACYYKLDFSEIQKELGKELDIARLSERKALIDYTIEDFSLAPSAAEEADYLEGEKKKKLIKKWDAKFIACYTIEKLLKVAAAFEKSVLCVSYHQSITFFFWRYVFYDIEDANRFEVIMQYMSTGRYPECIMIEPLCHVYDPNAVVDHYNYSLGSKQTQNKHKKALREYAASIIDEADKKNREVKTYFDTNTHYYCEKDNYGVFRYFETADELIKHRKEDISGIDFSKDIHLEYDFSRCRRNEKTLLPPRYEDEMTYKVIKSSSISRFLVKQVWENRYGEVIKQYEHSFFHFFDFVYFLKGDLTNADLLFCDRLSNLPDAEGIDLTGAVLTSSLSEKFGVRYEAVPIKAEKADSFDLVKENEENTKLILSERSLLLTPSGYTSGYSGEAYPSKEIVYYVSDMHLMHKLLNFGAKCTNDVDYVIQKNAGYISKCRGGILLIGGDIASDFEIFCLFVKALYDRLKNTHVIFVLGNHELWDFPGLSIDEITDKYRNFLKTYGMDLLQNEMIYKDADGKWNRISEEDINCKSIEEIRAALREARISFFGGIGFSGCNQEFNADMGIYRKTVSRAEEIKQSKRVSALYEKVLDAVPDKKLVIFTHMPLDCWSEAADYHKGFVYVSGHTHRNYFYDDGDIRIYADNQIGYNNNHPYLKELDLDNEFDFFEDYADGIHVISAEEYRKFYRGKNIQVNYNRDITLYMLKKRGYFMFIVQSSKGKLSVLNGGAMKGLLMSDPQYYYDKMDSVIARIKGPLDKYTQFQEMVSSEIKKIGGSGYIHGCIIDIDYYNHIYVNPLDLKVTGYWAWDMFEKMVYPSIQVLLENKCPVLYEKYQKLLKGKKKQLPALSSSDLGDAKTEAQFYPDTDIYKASREIRKMQKLDNKILSVWYEDGREMIDVKI